MASGVKPWIESVHLHADVLKENAATDIFALDLGPLSDGSETVAAVYRDAENFFRASFITNGLKGLLEEVLKRLAGKGGAPVLKLMTPFGGGKSHTMGAVFHAANKYSALKAIPEAAGFANPGEVRIAVVDGQFFNAQQGKEANGIRAQTLWGWLALKLGGKAGYELMRANDESRVSPGGDDLLKLFGDKPNLVLLDEVLEYLINAGGVVVQKSDLREQTLNFLKELTVAVSNAPRTAMVLALPSSQPRETLQHSQLLGTLDHFIGRKDQLREPVEQDEVFRVIQRRLLAKMPEAAVANAVAGAYQDIFTQMRKAYATSPAEERQAEEEGVALRDRMRSAYPFHPGLLDLMRQRWASLPEYQRTRGALRFLAACLRAQHKAGKSSGVLGPSDVLLTDHEVRRALIKELGLMNRFDAVFESDLTGANARTKRIDQRRAKENPAETGKNVATRLATAIFLYSFGGLKREGGKGSEFLPPGVSEEELLSACVGPDIDSLTAKACLAELKQQCLYLHFDGLRYCFKQDPNVTLLLEREADGLARDEKQVTNQIKEMLEKRLAGQPAVVWPERSIDITDKDAVFLVAYLPLDFAGKTPAEKNALAMEMVEKCGDKPRSYKNGLALAIPSLDQIEILRRAVRYLLAIARIREKAKQHNLTDEQKGELRERESTERAAAESAILKLYTEAWLPRFEGGVLSLERIAVGGRPLQVTLNEQKEAMIHQRMMELLTVVQPRVFGKLMPAKLVDLFKLGVPPASPGIGTAAVVDGLYSYLGFTRVASNGVVAKAIAAGVHQANFGYASGGAPALGADGKYQIAADKVAIGVTVSEDEIDLETGFLMVPAAIPAHAPAPPPGGPELPPGGGPSPVPPDTPTPPPPGGPAPAAQTVVALSISANRTQLFSAWNAMANLADMAGTISVSVQAEAPGGFDKAKLENGVMEPLREAGLLE